MAQRNNSKGITHFSYCTDIIPDKGIGVAIQTARQGDKIVKGATHAAQFVEPFLVPGPPVALSIPGGAGAIVNEAIKEYQNSKR